jgi:hypothetical protein
MEHIVVEPTQKQIRDRAVSSVREFEVAIEEYLEKRSEDFEPLV